MKNLTNAIKRHNVNGFFHVSSKVEFFYIIQIKTVCMVDTFDEPWLGKKQIYMRIGKIKKKSNYLMV